MSNQMKIMVGVLLVLLVGVSGYSFMLYTQIGDLQSDLDFKDDQLIRCEAEVRTTQNQLDAANQESVKLNSDIDRLQTDVSRLQTEVRNANNEIDFLERDRNALRVLNAQLEGSVTELRSTIKVYESNVNDLQALLSQYEKVPHSYYSAGAFDSHSNTYSELCSFLTWEFTLPRGYEVGVFDCSESAAYLEWALENAGFDAVLVVGPTPWSPDTGYHAWVIVYTEEYKVAIEATVLTGEYKFWDLFTGRTPGIVYSKDSRIEGWENYYNGYEAMYENIFHAIRAYFEAEEWDWWYGYWGFT